MKIRIVTVVWGAALAERLTTLAMRSLMAPGNIPALAARHDVTYEIHAPASDIDRIRGHNVFAKLQRLVEVRFRPFDLADIAADNPMEHWRVWNWAVEASRRDDVAVMLAAPDQVFADGTLARWGDLLDSGKDAVFCTGFQVVLETVAPLVAARFPGDGPIAMTVADLHKLVLEHLHPIMIGMLHGSPRSVPHAEWHLRPVPGQGVVQRVLSSHAYAFRPSRIGLTDNFLPLADFDRVAFEPSSFFGAEPLLKQIGYCLRPTQPDDEAAASYDAVWADRFMEPIHLVEARIGQALHLNPGVSVEAFEVQQARADAFVTQLLRGRSIVRLANRLQRLGLALASQWLTAGLFCARLQRGVALRGPATVFVPANDVIGRLLPSEANRLLANGGSALAEAMRAHLAAGRFALKPGDRLAKAADGSIATLAGHRWSIAKDGEVRVLRGPITIDDMEVYVIDGVLAAVELAPAAPASRLRAVTSRIGGALAESWGQSKAKLAALLQRNARLYKTALAVRERVLGGSSDVATAEPAAFVLYRRALALRACAAIDDLNAFHARTVLACSASQTALGSLTSSWTQAADAAALLAEAIAIDLEFAEAWLELGHARRECGDDEAANSAFSRAREAVPRIAAPLGHPDPRLLAATEFATSLLRKGQANEALAVLNSVSSMRFAPWEYFLCRARALVALERGSEALRDFGEALRWHAAERRQVGNLPKDAEELQALIEPRTQPGRSDSPSPAGAPDLALPERRR